MWASTEPFPDSIRVRPALQVLELGARSQGSNLLEQQGPLLVRVTASSRMSRSCVSALPSTQGCSQNSLTTWNRGLPTDHPQVKERGAHTGWETCNQAEWYLDLMSTGPVARHTPEMSHIIRDLIPARGLVPSDRSYRESQP
jgi:hypothetical protein